MALVSVWLKKKIVEISIGSLHTESLILAWKPAVNSSCFSEQFLGNFFFFLSNREQFRRKQMQWARKKKLSTLKVSKGNFGSFYIRDINCTARLAGFAFSGTSPQACWLW